MPDEIGCACAVAEPGRDRAAAQVDHAGRRPGVLHGLPIPADRDDPVAQDGDGPGPAVGGIGGEHLATGEDEVGAIGR